MKLAILYSSDPVNDAMVRRLESRFGPAFKVRERQSVIDVVRRTLRRRRDSLPAKLNKLAFYVWYMLVLKGGVDSLQRQTFDGGENPVPDLEVASINDPRAIAAVESHAPDLIVVTGTRILKRGWLKLAAPVLNAHFGLAPRYRGRFCWFWPVVEGHHDEIGATIHHVSSRVDAGRILVQERLDIGALKERSFRGLLVAVSELTLDCMERAVGFAAAKGDPGASVSDGASYPVYLEPGLTDYLTFKRSIGRTPFRQGTA